MISTQGSVCSWGVANVSGARPIPRATSRKRKRRTPQIRRLRWYIVFIHSMPTCIWAVEDEADMRTRPFYAWTSFESPTGSLGPPHLDFP